MKRSRPPGPSAVDTSIKKLKDELQQSILHDGKVPTKNLSRTSSISGSIMDDETSNTEEQGVDILETHSIDSTFSRYLQSDPQTPAKNINQEHTYSAHVPTSNRYQPLADEANPDRAGPSGVSAAVRTTNRDKGQLPPPIIIYHDNTNGLTTAIKSNTKSKFTLKAGLEHYTLKTTTIDDFRAIITFLKDSKVEHFTYNAKSERPVKFLIKYVPIDINIDAIQGELRYLEIPFNSATFLSKTDSSTRKKSKIPLVLINAPRNSAEALQSLTSILHLEIQVVPYTSTAIGQCYRCQSFGHSSTNCNKLPKCIRCSESHLTSECKMKNSDTPPKCTNCKQEHTANYRGCLAYKIAVKERERMAQNKVVQTAHTRRQDNPNSLNPKYFPALPPKSNYWTRHSNPAPDTSSPPNTSKHSDMTSFSDIFKEIKAIFQNFNIKKILDILKSAATKLRSASSPLDKFLILSEIIESFFSINE